MSSADDHDGRTGDRQHLGDALDRLSRGELPVNVALMQVLMQATSPSDVRAMIESARRRPTLEPEAQKRLHRASALFEGSPGAFDLVRAVIHRVDHQPTASDMEGALADLAQAFDRAADASPSGGSALYALGDPALLADATAEVVEQMRRLNLLGTDKRMLEVGCGSGRFLKALSASFELVIGVELSTTMAAAAAAEVADRSTALVVRGKGCDLGFMADSSVDLVLFADCFPYLVQVGGPLPAAFIAECARVLKPTGHVLILNLSYRGDLERDRRDLAIWAERAGLRVVRTAEHEFTLWDAPSFLLSYGLMCESKHQGERIRKTPENASSQER